MCGCKGCHLLTTDVERETERQEEVAGGETDVDNGETKETEI